MRAVFWKECGTACFRCSFKRQQIGGIFCFSKQGSLQGVGAEARFEFVCIRNKYAGTNIADTPTLIP